MLAISGHNGRTFTAQPTKARLQSEIIGANYANIALKFKILIIFPEIMANAFEASQDVT